MTWSPNISTARREEIGRASRAVVRLDIDPQAKEPSMSTNQTKLTLAEVQGTLDELAAAAKAGDSTRYRAALRLAEHQALTEEQISDAYRWGRHHEGAAVFDWQGNDMLWPRIDQETRPTF